MKIEIGNGKRIEIDGKLFFLSKQFDSTCTDTTLNN